MHRFWEIYDTYIKREGADKLKEWMLSQDIETAPASTKYHESYPGGLKDHSVKVFDELVRLLKAYPEVKVSAETVAICALLHDICKLSVYATEYRNRKNEYGQWGRYPYYAFNEQFKFGGHGSKSVYLIQKFMPLTDEEAVAVNCHMADDNNAFDAFRAWPFALLLHTADMASTITFD